MSGPVSCGDTVSIMTDYLSCVISSLLVIAAASAVASSEYVADPSDHKTPNKRGLAALTGVPGVLYSQYNQYHGGHVQTVPVPHPYPVPVPHPVPVQVPRPFPVTVHKPVGLPVPVGVPVPVQVPVPKPYPVPVPVNLPHGPSPLSAFGGSPFGSHQGDLGGPFGPFGASGPGSLAGKFGYGLGVYGQDAPSLPLAPPGLAASLAGPQFPGSSPFPGHSSFGDLLAAHPPKY